jgi:hypothetical protein
MVHRRDATHPGLATLRSVMVELAGTEGWDKKPDGAWLPSGEAEWSSRQ